MYKQERLTLFKKTFLPYYPNFLIDLDNITANSNLNNESILQILKDFERGGLLKKTKNMIWVVTEKGYNSFKKINDFCSETKPKIRNGVQSRILNSIYTTQSLANIVRPSDAFVQARFPSASNRKIAH